MNERFQYGKVASGCDSSGCGMRVLPLCWRSARIDEDPSDSALTDVPGLPGVYAIEGAHDSASGPSILYVGRTGHGDSKNVLASRLLDSLKRVWWLGTGGKLHLYSNVWDLRVRWATVGDQTLIEAVERILIVAHAPALNAQSVQGALNEDWADLLILNVGSKGRLLPTVYGGYYMPDLFADY